VGALVDAVEEKTKGEKPTYISPSPDDSWWVVDLINVVVHVFKDEVRRFYDLESLWGDAKRIEIQQSE
jgi:ribosome-associated protein